MSAMKQKLKAFKRRQSEMFMQRIGRSERTQDDEFDVLHSGVKEIHAQLIALGHRMQQHLEHTEQWCESSAAVGAGVREFFAPFGAEKPNNDLHRASEQMGSSQALLAESMKRVAHVYVDKVLSPLRHQCDVVIPALKAKARQRDSLLQDYDNYRRKVREAERGVADQKKGAEEDLARQQQKLGAATQAYNASNTYLKREFKRLHDTRMDLAKAEMYACVACQDAILCMAYEDLQPVVSMCPQDGEWESRFSPELVLVVLV